MIAYVINPGSSTTRLALAEISAPEAAALAGQLRLTLTRAEVQHAEPLDAGTPPDEQLLTVLTSLRDLLREWPAPDAVVARGGLIGQVEAGTYRVTPQLAAHTLASQTGEYTARIGASLALALAADYNVPAFIVDPPSVDELIPEARVSGVPELERTGRFHALNARLVARRAAFEVGRRLEDARVVVAHLGAGVSVTAFDQGRAIDTSGIVLDEGPFSANRAGTLPLRGLLDLAYSIPRPELEQRLKYQSGFRGLTGTADLRELERREQTDPAVRLVADAFAHQVAKALGAYSAALPGRPHAVAISGGIARWVRLVDRIERRVAWMAPLTVIPGELELEALAEGAGRVLLGLEAPHDWTAPSPDVSS
ncbi:butyrate kinase [Deinococcus sonorensis]|uniref:Probable butyrate kinase n=2 Tax=Deinococcus sonorensis TaxID=309891 RepID=A0AAU7UAD9_9DEIO